MVLSLIRGRKGDETISLSPASWTLSSLLYETLSPLNMNLEYRSGWFILLLDESGWLPDPGPQGVQTFQLDQNKTPHQAT